MPEPEAGQGQPENGSQPGRETHRGSRPLFACTQKVHGRIDQNQITLRRVDPLDVNFPHVETVIRVRRECTAFQDKKDRLPGY
jgi:hypothetical protein